MVKCLIIEDDFASALNIKIMLEELGYDQVEMILELSEIKDEQWLNSFNVIVSDVNLANGTFAFDVLKEFKKLPPIVFFTSHNDPQLYLESKNVNPYIFLLKPVSKIELKSAIEGSIAARRKVVKEDIQVLEGVVFVRSKGKLISIDPTRLCYGHSEGNYCYLHIDDKKIVIRSSVKSLLQNLNYSGLIQVHRAYVVNAKKVESVDIAADTIVVSGVEIPVGRKFKKDLMERLKK